ncbi:hypothetical protein GCM10027415_34290 [Humibacter ginsengisoli]
MQQYDRWGMLFPRSLMNEAEGSVSLSDDLPREITDALLVPAPVETVDPPREYVVKVGGADSSPGISRPRIDHRECGPQPIDQHGDRLVRGARRCR